jgi:hypothetical protein
MVEASLPNRPAVGEPLGGDGESGRVDGAGANAAKFLGANEAAFLQHLKVLNYGGKGDAERLGEAGDGGRGLAKLFDNRAPGGVAERVEDSINV